MPIRVLSFDLDNTLWHAEPTLVLAEQAQHDWLINHCPEILPVLSEPGWLSLRNQVLQENPELRHHVSNLRKTVLRKTMALAEMAEEAIEGNVEAAFSVFYQARQQVDIFPETRPVLEQLKRQYRLMAITNGNACVRRIGLADLFELALNAEDVGRMKPDPLPFTTALTHMQVEPAHTVHIGDHPREDVVAARELGMRTVWMNWQGKTWDAERFGEPADVEIGNLNELPGALVRMACD